MNPVVIRTTLLFSVCALLLIAVCTTAWAYAHPTSGLDKYKGVWLTTDKSIKIVLTGDSDPNRLHLAYFNKPDLSETPYTRGFCAPAGEADGIRCDGGLWFALRSDGKLATNEEAHPPGGGTLYFLFEKVTLPK